MDIKDFIKGFEQKRDGVEVFVSDNFPPFALKAITAGADKGLRKEATRKVKGKDEIDNNLYLDKLIIETVVSPNFRSTELQTGLKVMGAEAVLNLLSAGEYMTLLGEVSKINGFGEEGLKKKKEEEEEIKN